MGQNFSTLKPPNGWMLFNANNPGHYQVIFNNEQGQPEVAKYIKYISVGVMILGLVGPLFFIFPRTLFPY